MSPRTLFLVALLLSAAAVPSRAESFKAWAARAAREEREKNGAAAFQSYSNALSTWKPSDGKAARAKVLCARGALRDKQGDEAGALEDYTGCLETDKKNAKVFDRRGQLRLKSGKIALAIDDFYKAVALDFNFGWAYAHRAQAYELQGDKEFAAEDYRHACNHGVKEACPRADALAPAGKGKSRRKKGKARASAGDERPAAPPPEAAGDEGGPSDAAPAPTRAARPARPSYAPKFRDCLSGLQKCGDSGAAFGECVDKTPACEQKAVRGCCPAACLQSYKKALNRGLSEAEAYREIFIPEATCAAPPKTEDEE